MKGILDPVLNMNCIMIYSVYYIPMQNNMQKKKLLINSQTCGFCVGSVMVAT